MKFDKHSFYMKHCSGCLVLVCLSVFLSCTSERSAETAELKILTATGKSVSILTEVARTQSEQEKGYMKRKTIPDGTGMIFVYQKDQRMHFWMKNTPHPLSIAFISSNGTIREMYDMLPYSLETISSERSVRYALEVPVGWFSRTGVMPGDCLSEESLALLTGTESRKD